MVRKNRIELGRKLREYREDNGLTLTEIARRFGVHYCTISRWEQGRMAIRYIPVIRSYVEGVRA